MTRYITCPDCVKKFRAMIGKYPGETVTIKEGIPQNDYRCDSCNRELREGGPRAFAVSVSTNRTPYYPWEREFLTLT